MNFELYHGRLCSGNMSTARGTFCLCTSHWVPCRPSIPLTLGACTTSAAARRQHRSSLWISARLLDSLTPWSSDRLACGVAEISPLVACQSQFCRQRLHKSVIWFHLHCYVTDCIVHLPRHTTVQNHCFLSLVAPLRSSLCVWPLIPNIVTAVTSSDTKAPASILWLATRQGGSRVGGWPPSCAAASAYDHFPTLGGSMSPHHCALPTSSSFGSTDPHSLESEHPNAHQSIQLLWTLPLPSQPWQLAPLAVLTHCWFPPTASTASPRKRAGPAVHRLEWAAQPHCCAKKPPSPTGPKPRVCLFFNYPPQTGPMFMGLPQVCLY